MSGVVASLADKIVNFNDLALITDIKISVNMVYGLAFLVEENGKWTWLVLSNLSVNN